MSNPYIGEIRMFGGNFAPSGWALCQGQLMPIAQNTTLFDLIGTTYGGDGQTTFQLPDLRGRIPLHAGSNGVSNYVIGQDGGAESVALTINQLPTHSHAFVSSVGASLDTPAAAVLGSVASGASLYAAGTLGGTLSASSNLAVGGGQPHENFMPYLCVNFIISLFGIFPSQS